MLNPDLAALLLSLHLVLFFSSPPHPELSLASMVHTEGPEALMW